MYNASIVTRLKGKVKTNKVKFCATSGTITDEMIQEYICNHNEQDNVNNFKVDEDFMHGK